MPIVHDCRTVDSAALNGSGAGAGGAVTDHVLYGGAIAYVVPASLDDLHGQGAGIVIVSARLRSGPQRTFDLDSRTQARAVYQAVILRGGVEDQSRLLNARVLRRTWASLVLTPRCRSLWERQFPELAAATPGPGPSTDVDRR